MTAIKGHRYYVPLSLECYTGLRRGELLGLKWVDIDLDKNALAVNRNLVVTREGLKFTDPKTKSSRRIIPLDEDVVNMLKRHRLKQREERLQVGSAYEDNDLVFCGPLGRPLDPCSFAKTFKKILADAGLPKIRFHDMRHTHATILLGEIGANIKVVQERLGHTTARMTLDTYSHVIPGMQKQATEALHQFLAK